jgi:hypothetical protein
VGYTTQFELQFQEALLVNTGRHAPRQRLVLKRGFNPLLRTRSRVLVSSAVAPAPNARTLQHRRTRGTPVSRMGQVALHSPLLSQSLLLSLPPPTDMLKLGRFLCTSSGHELEGGRSTTRIEVQNTPAASSHGVRSRVRRYTFQDSLSHQRRSGACRAIHCSACPSPHGPSPRTYQGTTPVRSSLRYTR